jgi:hypothetical protein
MAPKQPETICFDVMEEANMATEDDLYDQEPQENSGPGASVVLRCHIGLFHDVKANSFRLFVLGLSLILNILNSSISPIQEDIAASGVARDSFDDGNTDSLSPEVEVSIIE